MRLLGPVAILAGGDPWPMEGLRRNAVLAALALERGGVVTVDRLVDIVWGGGAPRTASATLRNHVSHLRRALAGRASILARSAGYVLDLGGGGTDAEAAELFVRQAEGSVDINVRKTLLQAAAALWHGPSLGELARLGWFSRHAQRLDRLLLHVRQMLIDTRLELGEHRQLIPELEKLGREHPLDEHVHGQLMLALYRSGQQADALAAYQRIRRALLDDLGVLPGAALQDLEIAVLRQSPSLTPTDSPAQTMASSAAGHVVPAQLPAAIAPFTGRDEELSALDDLLANSSGTLSPVVATVSGIAGVGKTTLAVHWAHRAAVDFPDGQLYLNLRGYHASGSPLAPADALQYLLTSLGMPADQIPPQQEAQIGLYRSLLSGRKMLILLDNARDAEQIRPLLPSSPGCVALVTSRRQLTSLAVTNGAHLLRLRPLSAAEASDLIIRRLDADRVTAEPDAIQALAAPCAGLPLALAITAAHASAHPNFPLSELATQLRDSRAGLGRFHGGDSDTDLRAVFSWSYNALSPDAARMFRQWSVHPGWDIGTTAAASLTARPPDQTQALLTELADAHLITQHAPGRYSQHDLLRVFAAELADVNDSEQERRAATHRLLDHYLHTAHAATLLLRPERDPIILPAPAPGVTPQPPADRDTALAWFQAEHSVLLAVMSRPPDSFDRHTWQLGWTLLSYLTMRGYWRDNELVQQAGLRATDRLGDPTAQAYAHRCLARAYARLDRLADAQSHNEVALRLFEQVGNVVEAATTRFNQGTLAEREGETRQALTQVENAHRAYRSVGHTHGQAYAANAIGYFHGQLGSHSSGLPYCREALDILLDIGDLVGAANTWDSLGALHFGIGDSEQGDHCYRQAITLYRKLGDHYNEADTYANLIHAHTRTGNHDAARQAKHEALVIVNNLQPDAATQIRARLEPPSTAGRAGPLEPWR